MTLEEMKYHAQRMAELFPSDKTVNECECCHRHSTELRTVFEWRGYYSTTGTTIASMIGTAMAIALLHHVFHSLMPSKRIDFSTTHSLCDDCFAQLKKHDLVAKLVKQLCLTLIVLAAVILASVVVFAVLFVFPQPTKETITYAAIGLCGGLVCLATGLAAQDRIVRWCVPTNLRFISKPPFELIKFKPISLTPC